MFGCKVSRECMFLRSLSRHNKDLERRTLKPSAGHSSRVLAKPCYSSQANQCYSSILFGRQQEGEREREKERKERTHAGERVREKALWLLLLYVFSSTWACPMQIGLSQECCLFCLKFSFWSSDLPCLLATAILDSFLLFYLTKGSSLLHVGFLQFERGKWGYSSYRTWASHCHGISCCGIQALGVQASPVVACRPSCSVTCGIFPDQGQNPYISSVGKESACNAGDLGLIPGSGRSPGEGNGNPLQYSCLENPTDRGVWQATVHGVV